MLSCICYRPISAFKVIWRMCLQYHGRVMEKLTVVLQQQPALLMAEKMDILKKKNSLWHS